MENKKIVGLLLGGMCILLSAGIAIQIRTIKSIGTTSSTNSTENDLRDAVLRAKENYDNLYAEVESAEKALEKERENATQNNSELTKIQENIKTINTELGLTEVTGSGVVIKIDDNNSVPASYVGLYVNPTDLLVHDVDILSVVNELKNAGAEAISVNGQRIVANTVIECDGTVIKINGEKVGAPYEIKAIGMKETLRNVYRVSGYLWNLENVYLLKVNFQTSDNITIPKYTGTYKFNYAKSK